MKDILAGRQNYGIHILIKTLFRGQLFTVRKVIEEEIVAELLEYLVIAFDVFPLNFVA